MSRVTPRPLAAGPSGAPRSPRFVAESILVIRLGALGDVVRTRFAFPGLRELYPSARIDWLVDDHSAAGLDGIVGVDDRVVVPRAGSGERAPQVWRRLPRLVRQLRSRRYDLVLDFHGIARSGILARLTGAPHRVGYAQPVARDRVHRLYTDHVRLERTHVSRFERNAAMIEFLGGKAPATAPPLELPEGTGPAVSLRACVILHPGTSGSTRYKRWPAESFGALARLLAAGDPALECLVSFGPVDGERQTALEVVRASQGAARLAEPTPSVAATIARLRGAAAFVGSDSGPMHLASLAGTPLVALFGPTDPIENAPFAGSPSKRIWTDVGCNPCREGCPWSTCMRVLEPERVAAAVRSLIAAGRERD
ncbi:MAG: glycosyltransferase family 9 protein [Myxococcota bacterium]